MAQSERMNRTLETCTLISGASSGIGLAFVNHYLAHTSEPVMALSRHASEAIALASLAEIYSGRLITLDIDLTHEDELSLLPDRVRAHELSPVRVVNCAGMLHQPDCPALPEKRLEAVTYEGLMASFAINSFAPVLLAKTLLPLMPKKVDGFFASLSARVGSIGDNHLGGWYSYRAAKAAQNQLFRTLSIEASRRWPQIRLLLLHPGTTDTPLSRPFQSQVPEGKLFSPQWVATRLAKLIDETDITDSGRFMDWQGKNIDW